MKYKYLTRLIMSFFGTIALLFLGRGVITGLSLISYIIGITQVELVIFIVAYLNNMENL